MAFDRIAEIYDATRGIPADLMKQIIKTMDRLLKNSHTILDVGVGTGRFAKPLIDRGFHIVGVDISIPMMLKAREKGVLNLVRADVHHLPFRDESFDAATLIHLIHLVRDWKNLVREIGRVTKNIVLSEVGGGEGFRPRHEYLKLKQELGCPVTSMVQAEESLRKILPPAKLVHVGNYSEEVKADDEISFFEKGKSAASWDVPEDVHREIIRRFRSSYGGKVLKRSYVVEVAGWNPSQLRNFQ